jgi:hypothetical protein
MMSYERRKGAFYFTSYYSRTHYRLGKKVGMSIALSSENEHEKFTLVPL